MGVKYGSKEIFEIVEIFIVSIVIWLNYDFLNFPIESVGQQIYNDIIMSLERLIIGISECSNAKIIWFLFEDYYQRTSLVTGHRYNQNNFVDKINIHLTDITEDDISFIDLKSIISEVGVINSYDQIGKYRWNAPYSKALIKIAVQSKTKHFLVMYCDNVLWGGILSEDGVENLKLGGSGFGRAYQDFQRFVLSLYYHGVILAVCSKNDLSDVLTMFRKHNEMILKEEHIACFQVNWNNKTDNIKKIANTLNIGLDSIVFVDDSPLEIEAVKAILPEVITILYERDTMYELFSCFNLKSNTNTVDIEKRNETYHTNQTREVLKSKYESYADYINALEIKIDIHEATLIEFSRISELTQRTNKCTNGIRYTVAEIKERITSGNVTLYSLSISDRFSDLGLVGAVEVQGDSLTLFSLSCRVLGRDIESKMLTYITDRHQITSVKFKSTGKNEDVKTILLKTFTNATLINWKI